MTDPQPQRRILVVDDVEDNRIVLDRSLRRAGYAVDLACDGIEAIRAISADRPDLVLLDWMMPGLSGLETLAAIREHVDANQLPVIMCTALGEDCSVVGALNAGANDYVTKPINVPILLARIASQLKRKDTVDNLDAVTRDLEDTLARRTQALLNYTAK